MSSIDELFFRYYANRLLREGYISKEEYCGLLSANRLEPDAPGTARAGNACRQRCRTLNAHLQWIGPDSGCQGIALSSMAAHRVGEPEGDYHGNP